jgi:hypothetical protein
VSCRFRLRRPCGCGQPAPAMIRSPPRWTSPPRPSTPSSSSPHASSPAASASSHPAAHRSRPAPDRRPENDDTPASTGWARRASAGARQRRRRGRRAPGADRRGAWQDGRRSRGRTSARRRALGELAEAFSASDGRRLWGGGRRGDSSRHGSRPDKVASVTSKPAFDRITVVVYRTRAIENAVAALAVDGRLRHRTGAACDRSRSAAAGGHLRRGRLARSRGRPRGRWIAAPRGRRMLVGSPRSLPRGDRTADLAAEAEPPR